MVLFTTDFSSPVALRLTKSSVFQVVPKTVPYPCYKLCQNSSISLLQTVPKQFHIFVPNYAKQSQIPVLHSWLLSQATTGPNH